MSSVPALSVAGAACCGLVVLALVWALATYNRLVRQRNQVSASWAQIDVQLKRRHDLVPSLVETVRGYAAHEQATLAAVAAARGQAMAASTGAVAYRAGAEQQLTHQLGRLFALAEAYPRLQANHQFAALQRELATTEDKIAYARQFYNSAVQSFSNTIHSVPSNLVAAVGGFRAPDYFTATGPERGAAEVRF